MPTAPFRFFDVRVVRVSRLGPTMVRITFGGDLAGFVSGGRDQRLKLFLPLPGQEAPVVPSGEDWYAGWRALDSSVRPHMRSYTVCGQRRDPEEFDVDFALHGDGGPASRWAARARPGDRAAVLGPSVEDNGGIDFRPPSDTGWLLLTADETALPAVAGILSWLPAGVPVRAWIEVPHPEDERPLPTAADAEVTWLAGGARGSVLDAVRAASLPAGVPYAWIAGESSAVRALRRHLVGARGFDRRRVEFTGYWRKGASEEDLLAEAARA
ncbi:siderophore-interacting protein [Actinomadura sp. DC4]|uniref:siderophore-interacting protein n=1 Tax=Actinomadura sp. DC4 TaxID=3055069 RepID=UPI0025B031F7|nr:siderophore-interacting protein [Actinomadura sp. DC4]MDN3358803.1 siderophore-interacting protein [Actinomadura sp. DC4]